jgi:hypothetical protein
MATETDALLAEHAVAVRTRGEVLSHTPEGPLVSRLMGADDAGVLDFLSHSAQVLRLAEASVVAAAGEVARRSESGLPSSLASRMGHRNAGALIASRTGLTEADAAGLAKLGLALSPREGLTGEVLPEFFPVAADALADGSLSARGARLIVNTLHKIEPHTTHEKLQQAEGFLVNGATSDWSAVQLADVCTVFPDYFNPDGVKLREDRAQNRRSLTRRVIEEGLYEYKMLVPSEDAPYFESALDARTAPRRQPRFVDVDDTVDVDKGVDTDTDDTGTGDTPVDIDHRSWVQKRYDAFLEIAKDSTRHDDGQMGGVDTTVVVHVAERTLLTGEGVAWIEGESTPVSVATARRMACTADIIRLITDDRGHPLRLGLTQRFFTRAQRRAMAARDGGCVFPGCSSPPRWCDAAHIIPWAKDGPTDISNGLLLCHFHHRRFDEDGWTVDIVDGIPWFIPPSSIDAYRTPQRGGRVAPIRI